MIANHLHHHHTTANQQVVIDMMNMMIEMITIHHRTKS